MLDIFQPSTFRKFSPHIEWLISSNTLQSYQILSAQYFWYTEETLQKKRDFWGWFPKKAIPPTSPPLLVSLVPIFFDSFCILSSQKCVWFSKWIHFLSLCWYFLMWIGDFPFPPIFPKSNDRNPKFNYLYGKAVHSKRDEFSEKFQKAFDSPPPPPPPPR